MAAEGFSLWQAGWQTMGIGGAITRSLYKLTPAEGGERRSPAKRKSIGRFN
jgi:hypothetical protein